MLVYRLFREVFVGRFKPFSLDPKGWQIFSNCALGVSWLFGEVFTSHIRTGQRCFLDPFYTNFGRASVCLYAYLYMGYGGCVDYYRL